MLTRPDSIAWAFNIRGEDVLHTPEALSFAILHKEGRPQLFIDGAKLDNVVRDRLEQIASVETPAAFAPASTALGGAVLVDKASAAFEVVRRIEAGGGKVVAGPDPVLLPKALKNPVELSGIRAARPRRRCHGALPCLARPRSAEGRARRDRRHRKKLEEFRVATGTLRDISFDTIAGAGPNAAIPHYHVSTASNRKVEVNGILLVGFGRPVRRRHHRHHPHHDRRYPDRGNDRSLHPRADRQHPPDARPLPQRGTTGAHLDVLAREKLWEAGLDFDHGTGHGVGHYLSVHEGPGRIAKTGHVPLEPGMLMSNEPGFYKAGALGSASRTWSSSPSPRRSTVANGR